METGLRRLRFGWEQEAAFRADYLRASLRPVRFALLLGVCLLLLLGLPELDWPSETRMRVWCSRYFVACPALLLLLLLSFGRFFGRFAQVALGLAVFVPTVSAIVAGATVTAVALAIVCAYTLVKLRVANAALVGWMLACVFAVAEHGVGRGAAAALIAANLIGMGAGWLLEYFVRKDFLSQQRIQSEQARSEKLLLNILPAPIAARLKCGAETIADFFPEVTVLFADLVEFSPLAARLSPAALVALLSRVFSTFDALAAWHGLEKIKTIGDSYLVVGGLPLPQADHAERVARMALDMQRAVRRIKMDDGTALQVRIGIHTGPVVAGVIGTRKFSYDLWGDTVNLASRMESHGLPGQIQATAQTRACLDGDLWQWSAPRAVAVKGRGTQETYFLQGRRPSRIPTAVLAGV